ncbi:MAG: hypothetical protein ABIO82_07990 [Ginsengibacter sp.]
MKIANPENDSDYTRHYLDDNKNGNKIKVIVLKDYLKQRLGLEFRPRNNK